MGGNGCNSDGYGADNEHYSSQGIGAVRGILVLDRILSSVPSLSSLLSLLASLSFTMHKKQRTYQPAICEHSSGPTPLHYLFELLIAIIGKVIICQLVAVSLQRSFCNSYRLVLRDRSRSYSFKSWSMPSVLALSSTYFDFQFPCNAPIKSL